MRFFQEALRAKRSGIRAVVDEAAVVLVVCYCLMGGGDRSMASALAKPLSWKGSGGLGDDVWEKPCWFAAAAARARASMMMMLMIYIVWRKLCESIIPLLWLLLTITVVASRDW